MQLAAIAEKNSEHPLGAAIIKRAIEKGLEVDEPEFFNAMPGYGVEVEHKGTKILVGNRKLIEANNIDISPLEGKMTALEQEGKTAMLVAVDNKLAGLIAVADTLKDHSAKAVAKLKQMGLEVIMITGDNQRTANAIAKQVGVNRVLAEVLPSEKAIEISGYSPKAKSSRWLGTE